jgi:NAD(P)-dependent dehydrogenase (short-subunit alcohol dehydrogenase family)
MKGSSFKFKSIHNMSASKTILVTGGNRGIGLEICKTLAAQGHSVILGSRDLEKGKAAAARLKGNLQARQLDMADPESIRALAAALEKELPHLDVLINNAGIISSSKGSLTVGMDELQATMQTNYYGPFLLSQLMVPLLRKSKSGRIVNVSSGMGALADLRGGYAAYSLSKTALNAMTIMMASELRGENVLVNAMCPGWVRTDMGGANANRSVEQGADTAVWLATADKVPTGKFLRDRKEISW